MAVPLALLHAFEWFALKGEGYQFWSGIGSGSPLLALAYVTWRRHNCHVQRCWRVQWKTSGDHALCRRHHPGDAPTKSVVDALAACDAPLDL